MMDDFIVNDVLFVKKIEDSILLLPLSVRIAV